jgi:DNA polymerase-3 subunit epsilon
MTQNSTPRTPALTDAFAVLDFETTGLPMAGGGRAVEIGAVVVQGGRLVASFQQLMNPGVRMQPFAAELTGINNHMVAKAPRNADVMREFAQMLAQFPGIPLIAHNAAFDRQVLSLELARAGLDPAQAMSCSMLMARRVYPNAPNHKLGTLVQYAKIPTEGTYHRALADSTLTARLLMRMAGTIRRRYGMQTVPIGLLQALSGIGAAKADDWLTAQAQAADRRAAAAVWAPVGSSTPECPRR